MKLLCVSSWHGTLEHDFMTVFNELGIEHRHKIMLKRFNASRPGALSSNPKHSSGVTFRSFIACKYGPGSGLGRPLYSDAVNK